MNLKNIKIPALELVPFSFDFPNENYDRLRPKKCLKRKSKGLKALKISQNQILKFPYEILNIKASLERVLFIFKDFFICFSLISNSSSIIKFNKKVDFCLFNKELSFILAFYDITSGSLEYEFEIFEVSEPNLGSHNFISTKKSNYKLSNFLGATLCRDKLFLFSINNILRVLQFNENKDLIKINEIPIELFGHDKFQNLFVSNDEQNIFHNIFITFKSEENEESFTVNSIKILIKDGKLHQNSNFLLKRKEKIQGIFEKNDNIVVVFRDFVVFLSNNSNIEKEAPFNGVKQIFYFEENILFALTADKHINIGLIEEEEKDSKNLICKNIDEFVMPSKTNSLYLCESPVTILLEGNFFSIKEEEIIQKISFYILKIKWESPENALISSFKNNNKAKIDFLTKSFNFDEQDLLKNQWKISCKGNKEIDNYLLKINDISFLEDALEELTGEIKFDSLELFLKKILILLKEIFYQNYDQGKLDECFFYYKKILMTIFKMTSLIALFQLKKLSNEEESILFQEFKEFASKNILELLLDFLDNGKIRSSKIFVEHFSDIIFHNYWKIFEIEGSITKYLEKFLIFLPLKNFENKKNISDFPVFFWEQYKNVPKKSYFSNNFDLLFPEIPKDFFQQMELTAKNNVSDGLLSFFLGQTCELDSIETYKKISEFSYHLTGNPQNVLKILHYGYDIGSFEELNSDILDHHLFEILISSPLYEDYELKEFFKLEMKERFCLVVEANLIESSFIDLLKGKMNDLFSKYANKSLFFQYLKNFTMKNICSVKVYLEIFKIVLNEVNLKETILEFFEDYNEKKILYEHYRELMEIVSLLKSSKLFNGEEEYLKNYQKISEIAQILYNFHINFPICSLKLPTSSEQFLIMSEDILKNYFLNRKRSESVVVNNELIYLDSVKSLLKILFYIRDLHFSFVNDAIIYQVLCKKLLENSKFSLLKELLDREKLYKKLNSEIFESLILENIEISYKNATNIHHIEHSITKSLELLPNDSHLKVLEKAMWNVVLILQKHNINFSPKNLRNCNRINFLKGVLENLTEKDKDFPFFELAENFSIFDIKEEWSCSEEYRGLIKDYGLYLMRYSDVEKVKPLIELLDSKNSIWTESLSIALMKSELLSNEEIDHYRRLSLLRCKNCDSLVELLEEDLRENAYIVSNEFVIFISERMLLDKKTVCNEKNLTNLYKNIMKKKEIESIAYFFKDLTLNPARAFFQLSIDPNFSNIELLEEIFQSFVKSDYFDLEKILIGFLLSIYFRADLNLIDIQKFDLNLREPKHFSQIQNIDLSRIDKKLFLLIEKMQKTLSVIRKLPLLREFLDENEIKSLILNTAYRNEKLISILFKSHDFKFFEEFESLISTPNLNIKELLITRIVKGFENLEQDLIKNSLNRVFNILQKDEQNYVFNAFQLFQKIYEKTTFITNESLLMFIELCLKNNNINQKILDNKKLALFEYLCKIVKNNNDILKEVISNIAILVDYEAKFMSESELSVLKAQIKSPNMHHLYPILDESNLFIIAKVCGSFLNNKNYEEKIYAHFLMKILKEWDCYGETENESLYYELVLEMQKFISIFQRLNAFKRMQKLAHIIAKKNNVKNLDLYEIYSNIYSFVYENISKKHPNKNMSTLLLNVPSLITLKSKFLKFFRRNSVNLKSVICEKVKNFTFESLYEEETIIEIIDMIAQNKNLKSEEELLKYLEIDSLERYFIQKLINTVFDISENMSQDIELKNVLLINENTIQFLSKNGLFRKLLLFFQQFKELIFQKNLPIDINNMAKKISLFLVNDFLQHEDFNQGIKLLVLTILKEKFPELIIYELNNQLNEFEATLEKLKIDILLKNLPSSTLINLFEKEGISCLEKHNYEELEDFIFAMNVVQIKKSQELFYKIMKNLITSDKINWVLLLMNIGFFNIYQVESIDIDGLTCFNPEISLYFEIFCLNPGQNIEEKKIIKLLDSLFKECNQANNVLILKLILRKGLLVEILRTEHYSRVFDLIFDKILYRFSVDSLEISKFLERKCIDPKDIIKDSNFLDALNDLCWFGRSFGEVYLENILRLVEKNEYYDAAKLHFQFKNKNKSLGSVSIELMLIELLEFLKKIEKEEEEMILERELRISLRNSVGILNKLNK